MNTMTEMVQFNEQSSYCLITMDDGKANALSFDMIAAVNTALDQAEQAGKVVILCGRPGKFSAGFDLSIMGQGGDAMFDLLRAGATLARRIVDFDTPVVLAVSGHALAMGALLLLSADYRIGVQGNYKIGLNEVAIGMTLPYFGVALARDRLASTHVNKAAGLAQIYDPSAAVEAGYLDEAVSEDELLPRAKALAEQLSALDMKAHKHTKARVREDLNAALDAAFEKEMGGVG
jgi:enoyl-CoA hydratase